MMLSVLFASGSGAGALAAGPELISLETTFTSWASDGTLFPKWTVPCLSVHR